MISFISAYIPYVLEFLILLNIALIVVICCFINRVSRLRKRFERFMNPQSKNHNIEAMLLENNKLLAQVKEANEKIEKQQKIISNKLRSCIQYMGIVRYNTFEDVGGDLSYAIALMDEEKNGVVINSLYYREGCYTYGKPILNGESDYQLSAEEQQAITKALAGPPLLKKTEKKAERKHIVFKNRKKQQGSKGDKMIVNNSRRSNEVAGA